METIIILSVLALMVIAMVTNLFDFGVAPMLAVIVLALTGVVTFQEAFAGFTNKYVIVTAAFLVISVMFSRTRLINKIQQAVMSLQKGKKGIALYLVLILFVLVIASFLQPGPAALLLVIVVTTLPSGEKPANSQMLLPLGTLCNLSQAKLPLGFALMIVLWMNGFLEQAGYAGQIGINSWLLMGAIGLVVAVVYSLVAYRLLPKHDIGDAAEGKEEEAKIDLLPLKDEILVYVVFAASIIVMFFSNQLGDLVFIIPVAGAALLVVFKAMTFKQVRGIVNHQLIFLLAGIFALADIMANKGISAMLGSAIQGGLGGSNSGWLIMFVFAFATVLLANITGSNIGTMMIIAPIAASTAVAAGLDPRAIVMATTASAMASVMMPMDTAMGIIFSRGNYKLATTFKYTIPLTIIYIGVICVAAGLIFPM